MLYRVKFFIALYYTAIIYIMARTEYIRYIYCILSYIIAVIFLILTEANRYWYSVETHINGTDTTHSDASVYKTDTHFSTGVCGAGQGSDICSNVYVEPSVVFGRKFSEG